MENETAIRELIRTAAAFAKKHLIETRGFMPQILVVDDEGKAAVFAVPDLGDSDKKPVVLKRLRAMFRELRVKYYVILNDSWYVVRSNPIGRGDLPRPSECVDRREALVVTAADAEDAISMTMPYRRADDGRVVFDPEDEDVYCGPAPADELGTFAGLLLP